MEGVRDLSHFDHSFRAEIHHTRGVAFKVFGELTSARKQIQMMVKPESLEFLEDSIRDRKHVDVKYDQVCRVYVFSTICYKLRKFIIIFLTLYLYIVY